MTRICSRGDGFLDKSQGIYAAFNHVHDPIANNILTAPTEGLWKALRKCVVKTLPRSAD